MFSTTTAAAAAFACLAVLSAQVRAYPNMFAGRPLQSARPGGAFGNMGVPNYEAASSDACKITHDIPEEGFAIGKMYTFKISTTGTSEDKLGMVWEIGRIVQGNTGRVRKSSVTVLWTAEGADPVLAYAICGAGGSYKKVHVAASVEVKKAAGTIDDTADPANGPNGKGCANKAAVTDAVIADGKFTCSCVFPWDGANCDTSDEDSAFPANGPNGKACANGVVTDEVEGDGKFTCDCRNTMFMGDNCACERGTTCDTAAKPTGSPPALDTCAAIPGMGSTKSTVGDSSATTCYYSDAACATSADTLCGTMRTMAEESAKTAGQSVSNSACKDGCFSASAGSGGNAPVAKQATPGPNQKVSKVPTGGGGGDKCTGGRKYFDTAAICLGKAKDACPAADCEYKGSETSTVNGVTQYDDDEKCDMGKKLATDLMANKDVITFQVALGVKKKKCSAAATEADCSTAGKFCGWKTDYNSDNIEQGRELEQRCDMAAAAYYDGCGSLKGKVMSLMSKDSREKAAKMQKKATAAKAKVAAAKAKLAALPATATAEEKAAAAKEVTAAEAEETKYVAAAASSETTAAAEEKVAAENSTARALASCVAAVLASLMAGLMAF